MSEETTDIPEFIYRGLIESIGGKNVPEFEKHLDLLLQECDDERAGYILALIFSRLYSALQPKALVPFLKAALRKRSSLAFTDGSENLFSTAVLQGSKPLYKCLMKEAIAPTFAILPFHEEERRYTQLVAEARNLIDIVFSFCDNQKKDFHSHPALLDFDNAPETISIEKKNFEAMPEVLKTYYKILGQSDILLDIQCRLEIIKDRHRKIDDMINEKE